MMDWKHWGIIALFLVIGIFLIFGTGGLLAPIGIPLVLIGMGKAGWLA